jgi:hypothetical protein
MCKVPGRVVTQQSGYRSAHNVGLRRTDNPVAIITTSEMCAEPNLHYWTGHVVPSAGFLVGFKDSGSVKTFGTEAQTPSLMDSTH